MSKGQLITVRNRKINLLPGCILWKILLKVSVVMRVDQ